MDLIKNQINNYIPFDKCEAKDKEYFLKWLSIFDNVLTRENEFGHITSSAFVINANRDKMVMVYHNIFDGWVYPGGHADGESDLLSVALREVQEETGLNVKILDNSIYAIASIAVPCHIKREKYISAHTHLDVIYVFEADDTLPLIYREDESKGAKWISFDEATNDNIVSFAQPINERMIKKLKFMKY